LAVETACASHILVETLDEANEIAGLLEGGDDFAGLAVERSIDTGSGAEGGDLGCGPAGRFVEAFDAAVFAQPVGEVGEPVQTEFGFHLILVTERSVATFDDVRDDVEATLVQDREQAAQQAFFDWFNEALASSEVEIDPRSGTWDASIGDIVGPATEG
jgi:parvulin-like peptidyl-prolyl isomerase